jgi:hypothetical protein
MMYDYPNTEVSPCATTEVYLTFGTLGVRDDGMGGKASLTMLISS